MDVMALHGRFWRSQRVLEVFRESQVRFSGGSRGVKGITDIFRGIRRGLIWTSESFLGCFSDVSERLRGSLGVLRKSQSASRGLKKVSGSFLVFL